MVLGGCGTISWQGGILRATSHRTVDAAAGAASPPAPAAIGDRQPASVAANVLDRGFEADAPIANGSLTSRISGRRKAGCTWLWSSLVLPLRRWLVDEREHDGPARHRCLDHGHLASRQTAAASFRPGQPIQERAVPAPAGRSWRDLQHEPVGQHLDNAAMESFFSSLKTERARRKTYRTRDEARADVFDYIERFYNPKRRHSTLGYFSPVEFEMQAKLA
jgi:transposase InsO family protein